MAPTTARGGADFFDLRAMAGMMNQKAGKGNKRICFSKVFLERKKNSPRETFLCRCGESGKV